MRAIGTLWFALALVLTRPSIAGTIRVPEDYPTVSAGIGAAVAGDSVLIAIGIFDEGPSINVSVAPGVVVKGSGWSTFFNSTVLSDLRLWFSPGSEPAVIEDLWIYNRVVICENPNALVRNCRFGNGPFPDGVAIDLLGNGATIEGCFFQAQFTGGQNTCISIEGGGTVRIRNNVFDTKSDWVIRMSSPNTVEVLELRDNTFHEILDLSIELRPAPSAQVSLVNNIFAPGPTTFRCSAETVIRYNVFKGTVNLGQCHPLDATNLLVDPLMCDAHWLADFDGFALNSNSPCIGAGEGGSTIGALGIGCGLTGVGDVAAPEAEKMRLEIVPNPVRSSTEFRFSRGANPTALEVYDSAGRVVDIIQPGRAPYIWEPSSSVPPGVYFVRLRAHEGSATSKFVVLPR